ncbi:hypothetical protein LBMAG42_16360 [Deltaproteobacteria bacterium]|nr:hypothetical protein LBMAG42_16360 [Deltaproteobacteria bacterium]
MTKNPAALVVVDDPEFLARAEPGLREQGFVVRTATTAEAARRALAIGDVVAMVVAAVLPDDDGLAFAQELRGLAPELVTILLASGSAPHGDPLAAGFDDVVGREHGAAELGWRVRLRVAEARRGGALRHRERFLRGVVRLADLINPHTELSSLASVLAPALVGLPGVEGARIELDPDTLGEATSVVLEAGRVPATSQPEPGYAVSDVPLRGAGGGRVQLVHRADQQVDVEVREALGAILGSAISGARQFDASKQRQLRLERGYVDRHRKLSRVSNRLERLSEARDSFLALLSHDLRSPLAVVLGQVQLLEEGLIAPPQIPRVAATVRRQSERMVQMVEDLLDRYRHDDAVRSVPESGDAMRIVAEMAENLRPLASARRQSLVVNGPAAAPIEAEIGAIREVLANLLENAVRYSPEGSAITVEVATSDTSVTISILDQGAGFATRPTPGGSGAKIGLQASARILADAGGALRTSSAPAGGGLAVVTLPLAMPQAAASAIELYCADERLASQVVGLLAKHWEVRGFKTIGGAVDRMRRQPPAVVVIDAAVDPEGIAFVRRLKSDAELAAVPVLAIGEDSTPLYDAGALAVLRRPVDPVLLLGHVRRALRLLGEAPEPGEGPPDMLTGLPTARMLLSRLDAALTDARAAGKVLPVVLVRVDDLRLINRRHGWLVGDQLLIWLAAQLRERTRPGELAARVDAESFVLALPGRSVQEATTLAAEIGAAIGRSRPRLGVARVDVRVSAQALDLTTLAIGEDT